MCWQGGDAEKRTEMMETAEKDVEFLASLAEWQK
jgi:hypothetical protein